MLEVIAEIRQACVQNNRVHLSPEVCRGRGGDHTVVRLGRGVGIGRGAAQFQRWRVRREARGSSSRVEMRP